MTTVAHVVESLTRIVGEEADQLAREVGFIQRERALSGADFVQSLNFGWLQEPEITLDGLTQVLQRREVSISASGLRQRFTPEAASLLQRVRERLSAEPMEVEPVESALLKQCSAVIWEDRSSIVLPPQLVEVWRGCGGSTEATAAAIKLFVRWEVRCGQRHGLGLSDARCTDHRGPRAVADLPEGWLSVADLGFFGVERLHTVAQGRGKSPQSKRYFASRMQVKTALLRRGGHRIVLAGILPQQVGQVVEYGVLLGAAGRLPVRLSLQRVPPEVAVERRERIRASAPARRREASAEVLGLAEWTMVVTNVPRRRLSVEQGLVILRLRWQIERLFRLWKEYGKIDEWRTKKPRRILCEGYAKLCAMLIQQWLIQLGCWQDPHRSLVKAAQVVRREAGRLMSALYEGQATQAVVVIMRCMHAGCRLNTRKTNPNSSQFVMGASLVWPTRTFSAHKGFT